MCRGTCRSSRLPAATVGLNRGWKLSSFRRAALPVGPMHLAQDPISNPQFELSRFILQPTPGEKEAGRFHAVLVDGDLAPCSHFQLCASHHTSFVTHIGISLVGSLAPIALSALPT